MARRKKHEEHLNHEAWAIPYGDLITLLLAFFVVMYAISSVNEGKFRVLSDSLVAAFRGTPRTVRPIEIGQHEAGAGDTNVVQPKDVRSDPHLSQPAAAIQTGLPKPRAEPNHEEIARRAENAAHALTQVADHVERAMDNLIKANMVVVKRHDFWIEVEIRTDLLFPSASATLGPAAVGVIEKLAGVLAPLPNAIRVEGHTDNRPIRTLAFASNWELSAARAGGVVRVLAARGVAPSRLAVIGYGQYRPNQSNETDQGRSANRRVTIVILSTDPTQNGTTPGSDAPKTATEQGTPGTVTAP